MATGTKEGTWYPAHRVIAAGGPRAAVDARPRALPRVVVLLTLLTAILAGIAAVAGVAWQGGSGPDTLVSVRGETVDLYGTGLYRFDTAFKGGANRGADVVTIALGIPLLLVTLASARRGSFRARLLLLGALVWFLYTGASLALGTAWNELFLVYVALFSASLFGVAMAYRAIAPDALGARTGPEMPRVLPGVFMLVSGIVTGAIWLQPLIAATRSGDQPALLGTSTTMVTDVLDLGVILPLTIISGVLILRRRPQGYILAFSLPVLEALLAPMIAMQTGFQLRAGVDLGTGEAIGAIVGFSAIAGTAIWIIRRLLDHIAETPRHA